MVAGRRRPQALAHGQRRGHQPFPALAGRFQRRVREVDRVAVVAREDEEAQGFGLVALEQVLDGGEVAQALAHLHAVHGQRAAQQPEAGVGLAAGRLGLGHFTLVVREDVVDAAAVQVEGHAQVLGGHGRALDVPAGVAPAPRAGPAQNVLGLGPLPQREVLGVALLFAHRHAGAFCLVFHAPARELAVVGVRAHVEVDRAVDLVGVFLLEQHLDHLDLLGHVRRGARRDIRGQHAQRGHVFKVAARVALDHFHRFDALARRALEDAVFAVVQDVAHVGDVLDVAHPVAGVAQEAHDHVEVDVGLGVAQVGVVIHRRPAHIHVHAPGRQRDELFFFAAEGVVDREGHDF